MAKAFGLGVGLVATAGRFVWNEVNAFAAVVSIDSAGRFRCSSVFVRLMLAHCL